MTSKPERPDLESSGWFNRFLKFVEWLGNLLPHPVTLFAIFALGVILLSGIADFFEISVMDRRPEGSVGRPDDGRHYAVSLMNAEGLRMIVQNLVTHFTSFAPLGTVLVALLGVGVAEKSGLIKAGIRGVVLAAASVRPREVVISPEMAVMARIGAWFRNGDAELLSPNLLVALAGALAGLVSKEASEEP